MTPEVEKYIADLTEKISKATKLDDSFVALRRANDELEGALTFIVREGTEGPQPDIDAYVAHADQLANILRVLAKNGFRRTEEPQDCPDMMARRYFLTGDVVLWVHLTGENCKRVQVGTRPEYAIVCA